MYHKNSRCDMWRQYKQLVAHYGLCHDVASASRLLIQCMFTTLLLASSCYWHVGVIGMVLCQVLLTAGGQCPLRTADTLLVPVLADQPCCGQHRSAAAVLTAIRTETAACCWVSAEYGVCRDTDISVNSFHCPYCHILVCAVP